MTGSLKLGSLLYSYEEISNLTDSLGRDVFGWCDTMSQSIAIEQEMSSERKLVCKWHELLHGIANDYGIKLSEQTISTLAMVITQLLHDNPELRGSNEKFIDPDRKEVNDNATQD